MPKQPLFLKDLEDVFNPPLLKNKIASINIMNASEWVYKIIRLQSEMLKVMIELNDNVRELKEELEKLREVLK